MSLTFHASRRPWHLPRAFAAGHMMTAGEAQVMNSTFTRLAQKKLARILSKPHMTPEGAQAELAQWAEDYEFGFEARTGSMTPLEAEALMIAAGRSDDPDEIAALAQSPEVIAEAMRRAKASGQAAAQLAQELLGLEASPT